MKIDLESFFKGLLTLSILLSAPHLQAELDPELTQASIKNKSGVYIEPGLKFGQAYAAGGSNPGVFWMLGLNVGYVAKRDSWGRIEAALELGTGALDYRKKDSAKTDVTVRIPVSILAKFGYGWSVGESMFNVVRLGVGPTFMDYDAKAGASRISGSGVETGLSFQISDELLFPMGDMVDLLAGASFTHISANVGDGKVDGTAQDLDETINLNIPAIYLGGRLSF